MKTLLIAAIVFALLGTAVIAGVLLDKHTRTIAGCPKADTAMAFLVPETPWPSADCHQQTDK